MTLQIHFSGTCMFVPGEMVVAEFVWFPFIFLLLCDIASEMNVFDDVGVQIATPLSAPVDCFESLLSASVLV